MGPKMIQFILKNKSSLTPMKNSSFIVANFLDIPRLFKIMIFLSLLKTALQLHFFVVINSVSHEKSKEVKDVPCFHQNLIPSANFQLFNREH